jgi:glycosyltransferase involved in cell wall biosynthesis
LKENEIDIIHTHDFYTNIFGTTAAAMARVTARIAYKGETDGLRTSLQKRAERGAFRVAHRVVANCEAVREQLIREGVGADKIVKHYNGLDLQRVTVPAGLNRNEALKILNLPAKPARRFVTIVANLQHAVKNHPMFLRAAARVRGTIPDAAFVVAGEGELKANLCEFAATLGLTDDVFFIGRCQNMAELLFASEVCVLTSMAEGFSNAILEYMAAARPVVVTDVGGAREAVVDGETGYIVSSGNDRAMAEGIIRLLQQPELARRMGEQGRQRVIDEFSCERHLQNTLDLYDELLSQQSRAINPRAQTIGHESV